MYRIIGRSGAVVREGVEMSSGIVGELEYARIVTVATSEELKTRAQSEERCGLGYQNGFQVKVMKIEHRGLWCAILANHVLFAHVTNLWIVAEHVCSSYIE